MRRIAVTALGLFFVLPVFTAGAQKEQQAQSQQDEQARPTGREVEKLYKEQGATEYRLPSAQRKDEAAYLTQSLPMGACTPSPPPLMPRRCGDSSTAMTESL